jgi:hypothetical protein
VPFVWEAAVMRGFAELVVLVTAIVLIALLFT